jgi:ATP-dependent RNA helicase DDX60
MDLDLDDFGSKTLAVSDYSLSDSSPRSALDYIDRQWYADRTRRARLMDLIGDYAGTEPFALDGHLLDIFWHPLSLTSQL